MQFSPCCSTVVFFYIFGKHTFATSPIFAYTFFISKFFHTIHAFFFHPARSSTRWWWNGYTVWFGRLCVILIFYVCYSLMLRGWVVGQREEVKCILFMCGFFSMMVVFWDGKETNVFITKEDLNEPSSILGNMNCTKIWMIWGLQKIFPTLSILILITIWFWYFKCWTYSVNSAPSCSFANNLCSGILAICVSGNFYDAGSKIKAVKTTRNIQFYFFRACTSWWVKSGWWL